VTMSSLSLSRRIPSWKLSSEKNFGFSITLEDDYRQQVSMTTYRAFGVEESKDGVILLPV
jgi:hypothetical protein